MENLIDPEDFIEGTVKSSGERKFGYGIDVMRAWCASKDTDKYMFIFKDQIDIINKEVKLFRDILRLMLVEIKDYDVNKTTPEDFTKLSVVNKFMLVRLLDFS